MAGQTGRWPRGRWMGLRGRYLCRGFRPVDGRPLAWRPDRLRTGRDFAREGGPGFESRAAQPTPLVRGRSRCCGSIFAAARTQHDLLRPGLLAWLTAAYLFDLALAADHVCRGHRHVDRHATSDVGGLVLVGWAGGSALLVNWSAAMFALLRGDSLGLLHILPLYDIYQNFLVTPAWFISIVDEVRGLRGCGGEVPGMGSMGGSGCYKSSMAINRDLLTAPFSLATT